jgi:hypothetical protein
MQLKMKSKNSPCMPNQYFFVLKEKLVILLCKNKNRLLHSLSKPFFFIDKGKIVILLFQSTMPINL